MGRAQKMSGIGSGLSFGTVTSPVLTRSQGKLDSQVGSGDTKAVDDFLAYMKKSLAERMADAWLAAHGLDRDKLKAMSAEDREAVLKQMAKELKDQIAQAADAEAKRNAKLGSSAAA